MKFEVNRWGSVDIIEADEWRVEHGVLQFFSYIPPEGPMAKSTFVRGYSLVQLIYWRPINGTSG